MAFLPARAVAALIVALPFAAVAKTSEVSASSFLATFHEEVDAPAAEVWARLADVGRWWSAAHTYSGDAANLSLEPRAGGCWCERWKESSVEHGRVIQALPPKSLRIEGGLGPLQAMAVNAVLTFHLTAQGERSVIDVTYRVRADAAARLDQIAEAVDGVLGEQVRRLAAPWRPKP